VSTFGLSLTIRGLARRAALSSYDRGAMMRKALTISLLLITLLLLPLPGALAGGGGGSVMQFLTMDVGGRPLGMAGSFTGVCDDVNSLFYNPAGLASMEQAQATLFHRRWLADTSYSYLGIAGPAGKWGGFGASVRYLGGEPMAAYNEYGQRRGSVNASDQAYTISWARKLEKKFHGGLSVKIAREMLDIETATSVAVDLGAVYQVSSQFRFGLMVANIGPGVTYIKEKGSLTKVLRLGCSYRLLQNRLLSVLEATKQMDDDLELKVGGEYWVIEQCAVRTGYSFEAGSSEVTGFDGLTAGLGFKQGMLRLDYAISTWGDLGLAHVLSLTFTGVPGS
jgi:hypothetical protein